MTGFGLDFSGWRRGGENYANAIASSAATKANADMARKKNNINDLFTVGSFMFGGPMGALIEGTKLGDSALGRLAGAQNSEDLLRKKKLETASDNWLLDTLSGGNADPMQRASSNNAFASAPTWGEWDTANGYGAW